jgi:hypothetical protein
MSDQPDAEAAISQHTTLATDRHPRGRLQTHALDRAATAISYANVVHINEKNNEICSRTALG